MISIIKQFFSGFIDFLCEVFDVITDLEGMAYTLGGVICLLVLVFGVVAIGAGIFGFLIYNTTIFG